MHVVTMPPQPGERAVIAQICAQMARYTRSISVAESERGGFQEQWYGRERNLLRQLMMQGRTSSKKSDKDGEGAKTTSQPTTSHAAPTSTQGPVPVDQTPRETKEENPQAAVPSDMGEALSSSKEIGGKRKANP